MDESLVARALGISLEYKPGGKGTARGMPQRIAVLAEGEEDTTYTTEKWELSTPAAGGLRFGYRSKIAGIARMLRPDNQDGVGAIPVDIYPVAQASGGVAALGSITPSGTATKNATFRLRVAGLVSNRSFTVVKGAVVAGTVIDDIVEVWAASPHLPVKITDGTTTADIEVAWLGTSGNDIVVEVIGDTDAGVVFTIVQPTGGSGVPSVTALLAQFGEDFTTLVVNGVGFDDTTTLDEIQAFGEGRWLETQHKPFVAFAGTGEATEATAAALTAARTDDKVNALYPVPGSPSAPYLIAARAVARIATVANQDAPHDYARQQLTGIVPGADSEQWTTLYDHAVRSGLCTSVLRNGVVEMSDTVTCYAPAGETPPAYRYVVDICKLQMVAWSLDQVFGVAEWDGPALIPDGQTTSSTTAKRPSMAISAAADVVTRLGDAAVLSDPATTKKNITAGISGTNGKRWWLTIPVTISGNANIGDIGVQWSHFYGA